MEAGPPREYYSRCRCSEGIRTWAPKRIQFKMMMLRGNTDLEAGSPREYYSIYQCAEGIRTWRQVPEKNTIQNEDALREYGLGDGFCKRTQLRM